MFNICKKCKYYKRNLIRERYDHCTYGDQLTPVRGNKDYSFCSIKNKNGNCRHFILKDPRWKRFVNLFTRTTTPPKEEA